jgi:hypothetical protein
MAELKTKPTKASVTQFIAAIKDEEVREDCRDLLKLMKRASGKTPKMWGSSIVGFGDYRYVYASGREGDWFQLGFSPRKGAITLYLMCGLAAVKKHLVHLGRHKTGGGCLYIKKLADVDRTVLTKMLTTACRKRR